MDPGRQKGLGSARGAHQLVPCFKARPCGLKQGERHHRGKGGSRRQNGPSGHHHPEEEVLSWDLANPQLRQSPRHRTGLALPTAGADSSEELDCRPVSHPTLARRLAGFDLDAQTAPQVVP